MVDVDMAETASRWSQGVTYDTRIRWPYGATRGGRFSLWMAIIFMALAILALAAAEFNLIDATGGRVITIGQSGYAMLTYLRAIALAAISAGFGVLHIATREPGSPRVLLRAAVSTKNEIEIE